MTSNRLCFALLWVCCGFFSANHCFAKLICELDSTDNKPKQIAVTLEETKTKELDFCLINRDTGKTLLRVPSSYQMDPAEPEGDNFNISQASFSHTGWNADGHLFYLSEGVHHGLGEVFLVGVLSPAKAKEIAFNTDEIDAKTTQLLSQAGLVWERHHLGVDAQAWEGRKLHLYINGRTYEKTEKGKGLYEEIRFQVVVSIDAHYNEHLESVTLESVARE